MPYKLIVFIRLLFESKSSAEKRRAVLNHFKTEDLSSVDPEIRESLKYLRHHYYTRFPYRWAEKYDTFFPEIYYDNQKDRFYVLFFGKKMYFPKFYSEKQVIRTMRDIYKEQDCNSPHQYLTSDFQIEEGSIVVDCGVAEGNFALSVVDKVKKLYLVECDPAWIEALRQTFLPWKEKVIYVMKFISDVPDEMSTSIDTIVYPEAGEKYFIKLDIEGYEQKALKGMRRLVNSGNPIKMCVCTYHRPNDYSEIVSIIKKFGFTWHVSRSYLLFFQTDEKPSFRKVLIRAEK